MRFTTAASMAFLLSALGCAVEIDDAEGEDGEMAPAPGESDPYLDEPGDPEPDAPGDAPDDIPPTIAATLRAGCTAKATLAGHEIWMHFIRPPAPCRPTDSKEAGVDTHILTELTRLIDSVPAGGRIDGHIFSITVDSVAAALLRAQDERGVVVTISTDGQVGESVDNAKVSYLDKLDGIVYCGNKKTHSCISNRADAISHTKLFVFSSATSPDGVASDDVVWFGSANQTKNSGMSLFNNTVTIYGDASLYGQMLGYLDDLHAQRRFTDYYDASSRRGYMLAPTASAYASPEADTDLIVNRLNNVTPDSACRVRVMQASVRDSRMDVVDQLVKMKKGGCDVWVVADTVESKARARLKGAGISVRRHKIHDKAFIVYGKEEGTYRYRVLTGSHNLSISADRYYDEIFVKLAPETGATHPIYDAYYAHFNDAYNDGSQL